MTTLAGVSQAYSQRFGRPPTVVVRAPGRVNLIGEHTDYNDGFVLPIAIGQSTWAAAAPRSDARLHVASRTLADAQAWPLHELRVEALPLWARYVAGVAALLGERGARLTGADVLIDSDVPIGGGLSSSAALEISTALALAQLAGEPLASDELVELCRTAEHRFAGVPCGIMDQYASLVAHEGAALLLDCRQRRFDHVPCALRGHALLVVDSGVRRALADGDYARRREECRLAVEHFRRINPAIAALRDVTPESARAQASQMAPLAAARALHVVSENQRVRQAADALRRGALSELGRLMNESHRSLRDDFEVSCPELDRLVELLLQVEGVLGARLTGAGFGGCVIALVAEPAVAAVERAVVEQYGAPGATAGRIVRVTPGRGASIERG